MTEAYINIGSNIGDSLRLINRAVDMIKSSLGFKTRVSIPVCTRPWGYESDNDYINIGVVVEVDHHVNPHELFEKLQSIEKSIDSSPHRNPDGSYRDRLIDIDLIAVGEETIDTPRLTLPHPRMEKRDFVLIPMAELLPGWHHPVSEKTPGEMLDVLITNGQKDNTVATTLIVEEVK